MGRVALVHDYLLVMRGAERVFAAMTDLWPEASIFTLVYDQDGTDGRFAGRSVTTSRLQHLGVHQRSFRALLPVFPAAVRSLSLDGHDCVISSSSAFAHGVRVPPGVPHVCYCHAPFRYAWSDEERPVTVPGPLQPAVEFALRRHRKFDRRAARGVDQFVANSQLTRERIKRFWGRDSVVIHPPVDVDRFSLGEPEDYILFVGELINHKGVDLALECAAAAGRRIKVVGDGPERDRLRARYTEGVEYLGRTTDHALNVLYANAAALVVPKVEEFGMAAVEAQAAGRPVVTFDAGGARETVINGRTGILVPPDDSKALTRALGEDFTRFDGPDIRAHAQLFAREVFEARMLEVVSAARSTNTPSNCTYSPVFRSRRIGSKSTS